MPTKSSYPDVEIPAVDLWAFMFNQERDFSDDKGEAEAVRLVSKLLLICNSDIPRHQRRSEVYLERCP